MFLDGMADIADKSVWFCRLCTDFKTFLGHPDQLFFLWGGLSDDEHSGCIGIITIEDGGKIDIDDVAFFEHILLLRDSMANHLINTCTHALGVSLISQTGRCGTMLGTIIIAYLVDFERVHTCVDVFSHLVENAGVDHSTIAYPFDFLRCSDEVARWHLLTFRLEIHDFPVHLCEWLSRNR